jgi:hypothetical protein
MKMKQLTNTSFTWQVQFNTVAMKKARRLTIDPSGGKSGSQ